MEKESYRKNERGTEALDGKWYQPFIEAASFEAYEYLDGDPNFREEQKQKFISGEIENPALDYPQIDDDKLISAENTLLSMKKDILSDEPNEVVRQAYLWRINEKIATVRLLQSAASGDMKRFKRYSEFIYGSPSSEIFNYIVNSIRSKAESYIDNLDIEISQSAKDLLENLPDASNNTTRISLPDQQTIEMARQQTMTELDNLADISQEIESMTSDQIKDAFSSALNKMNADDWTISTDTSSSSTAIRVSQEAKQVKIPPTSEYKVEKVSKLIAHELGTHVLRRINGERSKLQLLGIGLDRYESGEEGIAKMREQVFGSAVADFSGLEATLAIGSALGLDGQPRNFRQTYSLLEKYFLFKKIIGKNTLEEAKPLAQTAAWKRCIRTFRGTDCKTPGVCFTKDIVYRKGNIGTWDVISSNPDEMRRFNIGKYDPSNQRHIWILEQLAITDEDLRED